MIRKAKLDNLTNDREWKEKNKLYTKELQRFFDKVDNIEDTELKNDIISQMLRCDKVLTEIAERLFIEQYKIGFEEAKK